MAAKNYTVLKLAEFAWPALVAQWVKAHLPPPPPMAIHGPFVLPLLLICAMT